MTKDEALKLALEFITASNQRSEFWLVPSSNLNKTVTAIREALAQPEPVAWMDRDGDLYKKLPSDDWHPPHTPLYTTPSKREWQGLTDEEMRDLEKQFNAERVRTSDEEYLIIYPGDYWAWQRAIEAKLKERNT